MKNILVIEDELAYLKLLTLKLTEKKYKVIQAQDGLTGLTLAKKEKPDLIILDIRLPVMDGITVLKKIRETDEGKNTKVIMLTNLEPDETILKRMVADKPSYYFVKSDIQLTDLLGKIEELI